MHTYCMKIFTTHYDCKNTWYRSGSTSHADLFMSNRLHMYVSMFTLTRMRQVRCCKVNELSVFIQLIYVMSSWYLVQLVNDLERITFIARTSCMISLLHLENVHKRNGRIVTCIVIDALSSISAFVRTLKQYSWLPYALFCIVVLVHLFGNVFNVVGGYDSGNYRIEQSIEHGQRRIAFWSTES